MKRFVLPVLTFSTILAVFWVGGLDFERGPNQAMALLLAIALSGLTIGLEDLLP